MTKPWFENKRDHYRYRKEKKEEEIPTEKSEPRFFKKAFTPKDVEELKPNFFVQTIYDEVKDENFKVIKRIPKNYRQVQPLVWDGKWRLKNQIGLRNIVMIIIILGLFFTGMKYVNFYEEVNSDPKSFCENVSIYNIGEVNYEDTSTIQGDIGKAEWNIP